VEDGRPLSTKPPGPERPRLLVLNQYYWPGVEATAHLLSELCAALSEEFEVAVVTGLLGRNDAESGTTMHEGVQVVRVRSTAFDRRRLSLRAVNYVTYLAQSLTASLASRRPDLVLCMTDPPIIGNVALAVARRFRAPLVVISQDVFPEIAVELKRLRNPLVVGSLRLLVRSYLKRADRVVAIGETMRKRLETKGVPPERISVIPNWVDTEALTPQPKDNPWSRKHLPPDSFVVMHSGNVGHAQNLDALVRAGTFLRDLEDLRIAIVGGGARHADLSELAGRLEVERITFLPYQPRQLLPLSLSSADVHVVGLERGLSGYAVPSRLYGILAVGRPVIVAAEQESETAQLVQEVGCGLVVPPGRPELLARAIRRAHDGELPLEEMGELGRRYVVEQADREIAFHRYARLLREVLACEPDPRP
jgi:colanic acid biosynthesis glycosyl transferase WcaI